MTDWIAKIDRIPKESDADPMRCVLAWHVHQGCIVTGYRNVADNSYIVAWQPCPVPPAYAQSLVKSEFEHLSEYFK